MGDESPPKIWLDQYDLNIGVQGGPQDSLEDVREVFDEELEEAIDRDPNLGNDVDAEPGREVQ